MKYKNRDQSISLYVELPERLGDSNAIEVSVWYEKGGLSYFTYKQVPRGFFAAVKPVELKPDGAVAFMIMDDRGGKRLIAPATKFSRKKLEAFAAAALLRAQDAANLVVAGQTGAALDVLVAQAQEVAA